MKWICAMRWASRCRSPKINQPIKIMHILLAPMLGSLVVLGGGSVGLILLILIIVLLVR
jgi:hypothetical protein